MITIIIEIVLAFFAFYYSYTLVSDMVRIIGASIFFLIGWGLIYDISKKDVFNKFKRYFEILKKINDVDTWDETPNNEKDTQVKTNNINETKEEKQNDNIVNNKKVNDDMEKTEENKDNNHPNQLNLNFK